jgi:hypothetical protein
VLWRGLDVSLHGAAACITQGLGCGGEAPFDPDGAAIYLCDFPRTISLLSTFLPIHLNNINLSTTTLSISYIFHLQQAYMMSSSAIFKRVESSAEAGFEISTRFSRIGQVLPSAVYEYTTFAEQILYLAIGLEQIGTILPSLELPDEAKIYKDLVKLLDFADAAYEDVKEALPTRVWDGEVELMLPFNFDALTEQVESLQAAATLIATILLLSCNVPGPEVYVLTQLCKPDLETNAMVGQLPQPKRSDLCRLLEQSHLAGSLKAL